jgi:hypothetical protein
LTLASSDCATTPPALIVKRLSEVIADVVEHGKVGGDVVAQHELENTKMELHNFASNLAKHYFDIVKLGLHHHGLSLSSMTAVAASESSTASPASSPSSILTLASLDCTITGFR